MSIADRIRIELKKIRRHGSGVPTYHLSARPARLPERLELAGTCWRVCWLESPLAIREAILEEPQNLVILTPLDKETLGLDLCSRLLKNRPGRFDVMRVYQERLQITGKEPVLNKHRELAELFEDLPDRALPRLEGIHLTLKHLALAFLSHHLGWPGPDFSQKHLFTWLGQSSTKHLWDRAPESLRRHTSPWLHEFLGRFGDVAVACLAKGEPSDLLALGIIVQALNGSDTETRWRAQVRLEEKLSLNFQLQPELLIRWAECTGEWLETAPKPERLAVLKRSEVFLEAFGLTEAVTGHPWLESALAQNNHLLAETLHGFLKAETSENLTAVAALVERVSSHRSVQSKTRRMLAMVPRLCRYLTRKAPPAGVPSYAHDEAWADVARQTQVGGYPHAEFQAAIDLLLMQVLAKRSRFNAAFARLVPELADSEAVAEHGLPIEGFAAAVAAPLARKTPLLWLVMDGMSVAVFIQLADALREKGWQAHLRADDLPVVAALPTTTQVSRASLFAGRLSSGGQHHERTTFARQWRDRGVIFHKKALDQEDHHVLKTIESDEKTCVAVVINAIDDALASGDQMRLFWDLEDIPIFGRLLSAARLGNRAVILVSDHGHLLEAGTQMTANRKGGERHADIAESGTVPGEMEVHGDRVMDGPKRLPWSENIRMGRKSKLGYHGGISPQEVVVAWAVFTQDAVLPVAWRPVSWPQPAWWQGLEAKEEEAPPDCGGADLPERVVASKYYVQQCRRFRETSLAPEQVKTVLAVLLTKNRVPMDQVERFLGMNRRRLSGFLNKLQRLLNTGGAAVLTVDRDHVALNADFLKMFFDDTEAGSR